MEVGWRACLGEGTRQVWPTALRKGGGWWTRERGLGAAVPAAVKLLPFLPSPPGGDSLKAKEDRCIELLVRELREPPLESTMSMPARSEGSLAWWWLWRLPFWPQAGGSGEQGRW